MASASWLSADAPAGFQPDETLDATNHVLMPGFVNAHTHAPMTFERGWAEDLPLDRWFNERVWVVESQLSDEDVYWGALLAVAEMIRGGTVAFADHYFYMDRVAEAVEASGLRALLAWCVFGEENNIGTDLHGTVDFVQRWQGAADGRIRTVLGPHSPYMCEPRFLARTAAVAARLGVGIHIHLAESQEQVDNSLRLHDRSPVEVLETNGVFDVPDHRGALHQHQRGGPGDPGAPRRDGRAVPQLPHEAGDGRDSRARLAGQGSQRGAGD